jgi:branched-chain amino acid transport system ATP-binding protein
LAILEMLNLTKSFGAFVAVRGVTLQIEELATHAIIGPNGAGKTTLFNLISGLASPTTGEVWYRRQRLARLQPYEIVRLGMARSFQRVNVFPRRTAFENVQVALIANAGFNYNFLRNAGSLFREEALELLRLVRCEDEASRRASELAYGKQKQLELAVALAARPKLLLLDEPTAGMSIAETKSTIALIKDVVSDRRLTLLFTEHDMNVVFEIASAISVLHHGEIVASGAPEDVRKNDEVRRVYLGQD